MVEKMSGSGGSGSRASNALHKRQISINEWNASATAKEKPVRLPVQFTIQFDKGTVFLSSVASGDLDETAKLLDEGVDIDYTNVDGLTALHQACIDENEEMVHLLLDRGANIEACDNEGWTPLHAAASAGNVDIAQILIDHNADLTSVNNEGEVPLDLAEEEEMEEFLSEEIDSQGLELEDARNEEERKMIEDANSWLNKNKMEEVLDWQGATALHVAASKGYQEVLSVILQINSVDVNIRDADGWTPLHAAVHWGSKTTCDLLTDAGADFEIRNNNGQTPCDLAEPEFIKTAEACRKRAKEIAKKPTFLKNKRIDMNIDMNDKIIYREHEAIQMLTKEPARSAVKGGREKAKGNNSNNSKLNDKSKTNEKPLDNNNINSISNNKGSGSNSGESGNDSDAENKPAQTNKPTSTNKPAPTVSVPIKRPNTSSANVESKTVTTNPLKPSSLMNHDKSEEKKDNKPETPSGRYSNYRKDPEKEETKEPALRPTRPSTGRPTSTTADDKFSSRSSTYTSAIGSRATSTRSTGRTTGTPSTEEKDQSRTGSTYTSSVGKTTTVTTKAKDEKDDTSSWRRYKKPEDDADSKVKKKEEPASTVSRTAVEPSRPSDLTTNSKSDWRSRLAERTKDASNDETYSKHWSNGSEMNSTQNSNENNDDDELEERVSTHSRRVPHRNLRETRRATGVTYVPDEDGNEAPEPETKRTPRTSGEDTDSRRSRFSNEDDSNSRMSIAERLRKKNQELLYSSDRSTSERTSLSDRSSLSDRYGSGTTRDRDSTSSTASAIRDRTTNRTSTTSSDPGDTKELQKKLDQALKEVQEYKQKYEKMKKEKEELEKKLEQYKEDIDKTQELKNDNLRLKDENGALIRVISKLSRTPASS